MVIITSRWSHLQLAYVGFVVLYLITRLKRTRRLNSYYNEIFDFKLTIELWYLHTTHVQVWLSQFFFSFSVTFVLARVERTISSEGVDSPQWLGHLFYPSIQRWVFSQNVRPVCLPTRNILDGKTQFSLLFDCLLLFKLTIQIISIIKGFMV